MIKKELKNIRFTIFIDKLIPFNSNYKDIVSILGIKEVVPVIYPNIQNINFGMSNFLNPQTNWALQCDNRSVLEVHDNKIDYFADNDDDKNFEVFLKFISQIVKKYGLKVRRLAYAPTYKVDESSFIEFCEDNIKNDKFDNVSLHDFSLSKVFYVNKTVNNVNFNMIFNTNIISQPQMFVNSDYKTELIVAIDINTRDTGNIFFQENEIIVFYNNIKLLNKDFLKNINLGE